MPPTNTALIGLSTTSSPFAPGGWASASHLPLLLTSPHYTLTAIVNSTTHRSQATKAYHSLPATVHIHTLPTLLAHPSISLIVLSISTATRHATTLAALRASKNVFVEYPLAPTLASAEELALAARECGRATLVGLQARADPAIRRVRDLLAKGAIGTLVSSEMTARRSDAWTRAWPEDARGYLELASGTHEVSVYLGHFLDSLLYVLGPVERVESVLAQRYATVRTVDTQGATVCEARAKDTPDQVFALGRLVSGVPFSVTYRTVNGSTTDLGFRWVITGTEGEIEITAGEMAWQFGGMRLRIQSGEEEARVVAVDREVLGVSEEKCPQPGTNTARLYEAFWEDDGVATFESALQTQRVLDQILRSGGWI